MKMISPSFKMAIIRTMNGEKSNFQINAISIKPSCNWEIVNIND